MSKAMSATSQADHLATEYWAPASEIQTPDSMSAQLAVKRAIDISVASLALLVLMPLFALVAILIKLESPGPVFFTQSRWGRNQQKIKVFKFRSMGVTAGDATGVQQTVANDPRVTRIGRFIRKTNIDELPQLINVLKGDMALVGPRCHPVGMLAAGIPYEELVHNYHIRHIVKPGMTGLAQCRGLRGPTVRPSKARARIAHDIYYVENFSLWLDLKIIFWTIAHEIRGGSGS